MLQQLQPEVSNETSNSSIDCVVLNSQQNNLNEPGVTVNATVCNNMNVKKTIKQTSLAQYVPKNITNTFRQQIDSKILDLCIYDYQPFSIVEDKGFKALLKLLCPRYVLPNRRAISATMLPAEYEKTMVDVIETCKDIRKCCLTTDCWSSRNNESFIAVTVHYINEEFQFKSVLLGCSQFDESHTSVNLAKQIKN